MKDRTAQLGKMGYEGNERVELIKLTRKDRPQAWPPARHGNIEVEQNVDIGLGKHPVQYGRIKCSTEGGNVEFALDIRSFTFPNVLRRSKYVYFWVK